MAIRFSYKQGQLLATWRGTQTIPGAVRVVALLRSPGPHDAVRRTRRDALTFCVPRGGGHISPRVKARGNLVPSPPGGSAAAEPPGRGSRPPGRPPCGAVGAPAGYVRARVTGTGKAVWITSSPPNNGSVRPHVPGPPPEALKPQPRDHLADLLKYRTSRVGPNLTRSDTSSLVRSSGDKQPSAWAGTKPGWTGHGGLAISREGMGRARHGAQRRKGECVNPSAASCSAVAVI